MCSCGTCDKLSWFFCNTQRSPAKRLFLFLHPEPGQLARNPAGGHRRAIDGPSTGPSLAASSPSFDGPIRSRPRSLPGIQPKTSSAAVCTYLCRDAAHISRQLRCGGRQFYRQATISSLAWVGPFVHCLHARNPEHIQGYLRRR